MTKPSFQLLAIFELGRLLFFLSLQANLTHATLPFGWYISAPLLITPFLLIYVMYISERNKTQNNEDNPVLKPCMFIYVIQKVGATTGFAFYIVKYLKNLEHNIALDGTYLLEKTAWIVIFFAIDVILSIVLLLKQNQKGNTSEG